MSTTYCIDRRNKIAQSVHYIHTIYIYDTQYVLQLGVTDKERKLDAILNHEKAVSGEVEKSIPVSCDTSIVRRILVVDGCIKDMLSEVEQRCQLDLLECGMSTGSRNILTEDSLMKRSRSRIKNRKESAVVFCDAIE